jgi:enoyl-CoA hydratase
LLTRQLISANEALAMGLVNKVEPDGEAALNAALTIASNIAEAAPIAVRYTKEAVNLAGDLPLQQGLRLEADLSFLLQTTSDRKKGVKSFLSKKKPRFTGR